MSSRLLLINPCSVLALMRLDVHQGESPSRVTPSDSRAPLEAPLTLCLPEDELGKLRQDHWSSCLEALWWASSLLLPSQGWVLPSWTYQAQPEQWLGAVWGSFNYQVQKC